MKEKNLEKTLEEEKTEYTSETNINGELAEMKIIMGTYEKISKSKDKLKIINYLRCINRAFPNTIDELRIRDWIIKFDGGKRDDLEIIKCLSHKIFSTLFEQPCNKQDFLYTNLDVGSCVLELYLEKGIHLGIEFTENHGVEIYEQFIQNPLHEFLGKLELTRLFLEKDKSMGHEEKEKFDKISSSVIKIFDTLNNPCVSYSLGKKDTILNYLRCELGSDPTVKDIFSLIKKAEKASSPRWPPSLLQFKQAKKIYEQGLFLINEKQKNIEDIIKNDPQLKTKIDSGVEDEQTSPFLFNLFKYHFLKEVIGSGKFISELFYARSKETRKKWRELIEGTPNVILGKNILIKNLTIEDIIKLSDGLKDFRDLILKNYAEIFNKYVRSYKNYLPEDWGWDLLEFQNLYSKLIEQLEKIRGDKGDKLLSKLYTDYSIYSSGIKKLQSLKKALLLDEGNLHAYYSLAIDYECSKNNKEQALENWKGLIRNYFKANNKINLKVFSNSMNEVGKIEDKSLEPFFILSNLIIKRSKEDMSKEYTLLERLYKKSMDKDFVPKPIRLIQHVDGYNYLIMRETDISSKDKCDDVRTLTETINYVANLQFKEDVSKSKRFNYIPREEITTQFKMKYLKECLKNLIYLQEELESFNLKKESCDFRDIVKNKISDRLKNNNLVESLNFVVEKIDCQEKCFTHGDYHSGNILIKGGKCVPIDFERVNYLPLLYDVAFLLEQKEFSDLNGGKKKELISYFFKNKNKSFSSKESKDYDYMSLFINLRKSSISSRLFNSSNEEVYKEDIKFYVKKADEIINKMLTYTSGKEHDNLKNLKEVINQSDILK